MSQLARSKNSFSGKSVQSYTANVEKDAEAGTDVINWRTMQRVYLDEVGTPVNDVVSVGAGESALQAGSSDVGPVIELKSFADSSNIVASTNVDGDEISFDLTPTGVTAGVYANPVVTFDANGRAIAAADGGGGAGGSRAVTVGAGESVVQNPPDVGPDLEFKSIGNSANIVASTNVGGDEISLDLTPTGITARQYTNATVTFDANGRAIAAADGAVGGLGDDAGYATMTADGLQTIANTVTATVLFPTSTANTNALIFDTTTSSAGLELLEGANYHVDVHLMIERASSGGAVPGAITATVLLDAAPIMEIFDRDTFIAGDTLVRPLSGSTNITAGANNVLSVSVANTSGETLTIRDTCFITVHQLTGSAGAQGEPGPAGPPGPAGSLDSVASVGGFNSLLQGGAVSDSGPVVELKSLEEGPGVTMVPSANSLQVGLETVPGIPVGVATNYATVTLDNYGRVIALTPGTTPPVQERLFEFIQEGAEWASNPLYFIQNGGGAPDRAPGDPPGRYEFFPERQMTIVSGRLTVINNPGVVNGPLYPQYWIALALRKFDRSAGSSGSYGSWINIADFENDLLNNNIPSNGDGSLFLTNTGNEPYPGIPITLDRGDFVQFRVRKEGRTSLGGPVSLYTSGASPNYVYASVTAYFN